MRTVTEARGALRRSLLMVPALERRLATMVRRSNTLFEITFYLDLRIQYALRNYFLLEINRRSNATFLHQNAGSGWACPSLCAALMHERARCQKGQGGSVLAPWASHSNTGRPGETYQ